MHKPGERVVFLAHFDRGFGLPVSKFFRDFLDFYRLQPHHLARQRRYAPLSLHHAVRGLPWGEAFCWPVVQAF